MKQEERRDKKRTVRKIVQNNEKAIGFYREIQENKVIEMDGKVSRIERKRELDGCRGNKIKVKMKKDKYII